MSKDLLYFGCRHHVLEIILASAFNLYFGTSTGPNVEMFVRFQNSSGDIHKSKFSSCSGDKDVMAIVNAHRNRIRKFYTSILQKNQPRDDYREFLKLVLIFTGDKDVVNFKAPGAMHHARCMAKAIYFIKIYLFRD